MSAADGSRGACGSSRGARPRPLLPLWSRFLPDGISVRAPVTRPPHNASTLAFLSEPPRCFTRMCEPSSSSRPGAGLGMLPSPIKTGGGRLHWISWNRSGPPLRGLNVRLLPPASLSRRFRTQRGRHLPERPGTQAVVLTVRAALGTSSFSVNRPPSYYPPPELREDQLLDSRRRCPTRPVHTLSPQLNPNPVVTPRIIRRRLCRRRPVRDDLLPVRTSRPSTRCRNYAPLDRL